MEKHEFKAESKRLLDLMINSIYTHKEIFLREIISNASDAIDKLYYTSLTDDKVGLSREDFEIKITIDKENRTLTISDNGIGMNADDLENNLGIIANSGSFKFRDEMESNVTDADLIGQFGVGFYSAFMVSDRITVITRKYGEDQGWRWKSSGADGFEIAACTKKTVGTDVIMHIREDSEEEKDEYSQYLREYPIYKLVKKYSDYIRFPIKMLMPHPVLKEGSTEENPEYEEVFEYEVLNSMQPIWQRTKGEVTKEEYEEFYKEHYHEKEAPRIIIPISVEGNITYRALLFIPEKSPKEYDTDEYVPGLALYSSGVKIMEHCVPLLPEAFDFVRGVVDSPDLSLNISREMLQHDKQLKVIASNIEKKIKAELERLMRDDRPAYEDFFKHFGRRIKVCAMDNYGEKKEQLQNLILFWSSKNGRMITLKDYVDAMPEDQKYIYYASGHTVEAIDRLPQTEVLKEKGYDILYFTDKADELVADMFKSYSDKLFRSAIDGDLGLEEAAPELSSEADETLKFIKEVLGDRVDEVMASSKLKTHPVCLSSGKGISFDMEKYFRAMNPNVPVKAKRILEVNTLHDAFTALELARISDPDKARKYSEILYNQACMIAGLPVADPSGYTDLICSLW